MARIQLLLCSAALLALTAGCSSHGRLAMNGGIGGDDGRAPEAEDPGGGTGQPPSNATQGAVEQTAGAVVATAGNLGGVIDGGDPAAGAGEAVNPLARVSVDGEQVSGSDGGTAPLGASIASPDQEQGQLATLGVLSDGQVVTAQTAVQSGESADLVGAGAGENQVLGSGQGQTVAVNALSSNNTSGDAASVNALSGGQTANVQVNGATPPLTPATSITDTLGDLLDGGG